MKRGHGPTSTPKAECTNKRLRKWRVRCDFAEEATEEGGICVSFEETEFFHKPTIEEVKNYVLGVENRKIDNLILSSFEWNGMKVWLSSENQFNYKAAYDLAIQTDGASLPVKFKFGTSDNPVYYTFTTKEEISDFYSSAITFINKTLEEGWKKKDSLHWSAYETLLNEN